MRGPEECDSKNKSTTSTKTWNNVFYKYSVRFFNILSLEYSQISQWEKVSKMLARPTSTAWPNYTAAKISIKKFLKNFSSGTSFDQKKSNKFVTGIVIGPHSGRTALNGQFGLWMVENNFKRQIWSVLPNTQGVVVFWETVFEMVSELKGC